MIDVEHAPAKINLALHVRRRRDDGYHEIETLFAFTELGDTVALLGDGLERGTTIEVALDGPFASALAAGDTLVRAAAHALAAAAGVPPRARLRLTKRLPVAAGLGGGSADAAATLRLLARAWDLDWSLARLADIGAALGADVPACVHSRPMRGEGLGDRLAPVALAGAAVVLVNPGVAVATGSVFAAWDRVDRGPLALGDALAAAVGGRNDLERPAIVTAPVIAEVLGQLRAEPDAFLARMSGSGGTCFALFETDAAAARATARLARAYPDWWIAASRVAGA